MKEMQRFAGNFHKEMGWEISTEQYDVMRASLLNNYMLWTTEVSEVAEELRKLFNMTHKLMKEGETEERAFRSAKDHVRENIGKELADCLAYMLKLANFFDLDMEQAFYAKMAEVKARVNKDIPRSVAKR